MPKPLFSVRVRVPASSANLGPGFDCLGIALTLYDEWRVEGRAGEPSVRIAVDGADGIPTDGRNLAYQAFRKVFQIHNRPLPALRMDLKSRIPVAGGLGSSSAAIVGGLVSANRALGDPMTRDQLLDIAAEFEGHPDNVAPALFGGFCAATYGEGKVQCVSWQSPALFRDLVAVVAIPYFELKTEKARAVLPKNVSRLDAVFNTGRAALLVAALLSKRYDLLGEAMCDRLHEPYRQKLIPGFSTAITAAESAGAYGAALSGAGPTLLSLAPRSKTTAVGEAMVAAFRDATVPARSEILELDLRGARVTGF